MQLLQMHIQKSFLKCLFPKQSRPEFNNKNPPKYYIYTESLIEINETSHWILYVILEPVRPNWKNTYGIYMSSDINMRSQILYLIWNLSQSFINMMSLR